MARPADATDRRGRLIRAIIFDLDGVIVDSEIWWDEVRHAFARDHGRPWTQADQHAVMGSNSAQWSATMRERLDLDLADSDIQAAIVNGVVARYERDGPPTIEGAVEAVRRIAADRPTALASSSHRRVIDTALAATGLTDVFEAVVSSDEVAQGKPAPDVFLAAAGRIGIPPGEVLVVEDSLNGLKAAKAAGMATVLVPNHSVPPAPGWEPFADAVLNRLADLHPDRLLARLPAGADRP